MKSLAFVLAVVVLVALAVGSAIVVDTTEYAVVTRFGRPVRTYTAPGLHFRIPFVDQVVRLDARLLMTEPPAAEYLTLDKKNVVARTFLTWRVDDPLRYIQTVQLRDAAEARLAAVTSSEIGAAFGSVPFDALVSTDADKMRLGAIIDQVEQRVRDTAAREYGVKLVSLRVERLAFPQQNEASVFQRMRAERQRNHVIDHSRRGPRRSPSSSAPRGRSSRSGSAPRPTASGPASSRRPTGRRPRSADRPRPRRHASMPRPSRQTRTSTASSARSRYTTRSSTRTRRSSCRPTRRS